MRRFQEGSASLKNLSFLEHGTICVFRVQGQVLGIGSQLKVTVVITPVSLGSASLGTSPVNSSM